METIGKALSEAFKKISFLLNLSVLTNEGYISYYEMKEATTIFEFELALWKVKLDQTGSNIS